MNCPTCAAAVAVDETAIERGEAPLPAHFPFCSERCRLVDLGRWASGDFRIPGAAVDPYATTDDENADGA